MGLSRNIRSHHRIQPAHCPTAHPPRVQQNRSQRPLQQIRRSLTITYLSALEPRPTDHRKGPEEEQQSSLYTADDSVG